jgi:twitching motility two-component system response regulator PilG
MSNVALQFTIPTGIQGGRHFLTPAVKSILVIDDSPTIRKIVEMALQREGYEVMSFHDGIDAMKWLATPGSRIPDLIVVDISLPKMDGYEIIRRFRANPRFANTICMILSRHDKVEDKLKGRSAGANAYITKPFTIQELLATIRTQITGASVSDAF